MFLLQLCGSVFGVICEFEPQYILESYMLSSLANEIAYTVDIGIPN